MMKKSEELERKWKLAIELEETAAQCVALTEAIRRDMPPDKFYDRTISVDVSACKHVLLISANELLSLLESRRRQAAIMLTEL